MFIDVDFFFVISVPVRNLSLKSVNHTENSCILKFRYHLSKKYGGLQGFSQGNWSQEGSDGSPVWSVMMYYVCINGS